MINSVQNLNESSSKLSGFFEKWSSSKIEWERSTLKLPEEEIKILAVTWNMQGLPAPKDLSNLLLTQSPHHIYAISTQECLRSIFVSLFYSSKSTWEDTVMTTLGSEYFLVGSESVGATHLMLVAHQSLAKQISSVRVATVLTGFFNLMPNKGAIGIRLSIGNSKIMFVGCHLTSGEGCADDRNADFLRIETELGKFGLLASETVDSIIVFGDLNYRIKGSATQILSLIKDAAIENLYKKDELNLSMKTQGPTHEFKEGKIQFPPTYKLNKNTYSKNRCPSWTDRVLYKDTKNILTQNSYGSIMTINHSDHRPVYSQFTLKI